MFSFNHYLCGWLWIFTFSFVLFPQQQLTYSVYIHTSREGQRSQTDLSVCPHSGHFHSTRVLLAALCSPASQNAQTELISFNLALFPNCCLYTCYTTITHLIIQDRNFTGSYLIFIFPVHPIAQLRSVTKAVSFSFILFPGFSSTPITTAQIQCLLTSPLDFAWVLYWTPWIKLSSQGHSTYGV